VSHRKGSKAHLLLLALLASPILLGSEARPLLSAQLLCRLGGALLLGLVHLLGCPHGCLRCHLHHAKSMVTTENKSQSHAVHAVHVCLSRQADEHELLNY